LKRRRIKSLEQCPNCPLEVDIIELEAKNPKNCRRVITKWQHLSKN